VGINLTKYDQLDLKLKLWNENKFNYFLPKDEYGNLMPFPQQEQFWTVLKSRRIKHLLYGGGAGGAKTHGAVAAMLFEHLAIDGLHSGMGRKNLTDLKDTTLVSFFDAMNIYDIPKELVWYNDQKNKLMFHNGSKIDFIQLKYEPSDPKYGRLGSRMYSYFVIEEGQEVHFQAYVILSTRVGRQYHIYKKLGYVINQMIVTMNPYKHWGYELFYLPSVNGTIDAKKMFIKALAKDNPTTPQEYLDTLDEIPDPIERARLRDGVWEYEDKNIALFKYSAISRMFEDNPSETFGGNYITCDPARKGKDEAVIMVWEGFRVFEIHIAAKCSTVDIEQRIFDIQKEHRVPNSNVIIDSNGLGGGVKDHVPDSFEYISHSKPIVDYLNNERASSDNPSGFDQLRDQVFWVASDMVLKNIPVFAENLNIFRFGEYTEHYTRQKFRDEFRKELEKIYRESEESDKKIKLTKKHEIANLIGRSTNFTDCWSMRFITDSDVNTRSDKQFGIGIVPEADTEENRLYRKLVS